MENGGISRSHPIGRNLPPSDSRKFAGTDGLNRAGTVDFTLEIGYCSLESLPHRVSGLPSKLLLSQGNIRAALPWVVLRRLAMYDPARRVCNLRNELCKVPDGVLVRVAQIDRVLVVPLHQGH